MTSASYDEAPALELLHRDAHVAAFSKSSGLLVHRGWGRDRVTALDLARHRLGQHVFPVHRLDRATSGVLLFALDSPTAAAIQRSMQAGQVLKTYVALVRGLVPAAGTIDHPVRRDEEGDERVSALTDFERVGVAERCSLVLARPRTGRLHQLRRHFKHISHPIVGDVQYGKGDINRHFRQLAQLHRLALHALRLELTHPATGQRLKIGATVPADLAAPLERLGLFEELLRIDPSSACSA